MDWISVMHRAEMRTVAEIQETTTAAAETLFYMQFSALDIH
jgi:hypothetical protein